MEDTLNVNGVVEITTSAMSQSQSPFRLGGSQTSSAFSTGFVYDTNGDIVTNES